MLYYNDLLLQSRLQASAGRIEPTEPEVLNKECSILGKKGKIV